MTHTLHRYDRGDGSPGDYVVLAMPASAMERQKAVAGEKEFLRRALAHGPVNVGDSAHGAGHRPQRHLGPAVHWRRDDAPDPAEVVERVDRPSAVSAVFDDLDAVGDFLAELKEARLGLSINLSAPVEDSREACRRAGLTRHSVEYSLGFLGGVERLPGEEALELCTMCGHGMISAGLAGKMADWVKTGRRSPGAAGRTLARFCNCGAFNPVRAERVLSRLGRAAPPPGPDDAPEGADDAPGGRDGPREGQGDASHGTAGRRGGP